MTSPKGVGDGAVVKGELSEKNGKRIEREREGETKQDMGFELWPRHHSSPRRPIENPLLMSGFHTVHSGTSKMTSTFLALRRKVVRVLCKVHLFGDVISYSSFV